MLKRRCHRHVIAISYFAILRYTLRYKSRAAETSRPFRGLPLWRGRLGVGCWIQHETLVGCMATSIYTGETDLLVTRYTLDTSCFSGTFSARSWSATTKLGRVFAFVSRLSSARGIGSKGAGKAARQGSQAKKGWGLEPGGVCTRGVSVRTENRHRSEVPDPTGTWPVVGVQLRA